MLCYRLYEQIPGRSSLGFGPGGGRWNHSGTPIIYASNCISLSFLELYSIRGPVVIHSRWILAAIEIPDEIAMLEKESLPTGWNKRPASNSTKDFGTKWAASKDSLWISVPSARIPLSAYPEEHNILINPLYQDFIASVKVVSEEEVSFAVQDS